MSSSETYTTFDSDQNDNGPGPGVTFNESMSGPFSLGIEDPRSAPAASHYLTINVTVTIDDISQFIKDPTHSGSLSGSIDFEPFGQGIPADSGSFNLFAPSDRPDLTHMIYELSFHHAGQDYYLSGHKEVRDDPGFDLWSDTTTLYTTLHQGNSRAGEVVGSGILRLGVKELLKLVSTVRAINATSTGDQAKAISQFGRFFLRELWDTYRPRNIF